MLNGNISEAQEICSKYSFQNCSLNLVTMFQFYCFYLSQSLNFGYNIDNNDDSI
jgi:hypothetical protein